jgi:hypothetical protein
MADTPRTPTRCVLDTNRPRLVAVGKVCRNHADQIGELLDPDQRGQIFHKPEDRLILPSIPVLYELLDATPRVGEKLGGGAFRSSPPGDVRIMAHRDLRSRAGGAGRDDDDDDAPWPVLGTLVTIARRLDVRDLDNRPVPLPRVTPPPVDQWTSKYPDIIGLAGAQLWTRPRLRPVAARPVADYARWLHARVDLLCDTDWVPDLWHDLKTLHSQLRGGIGDPAPPPVGRCWQPVDDDHKWSERGPGVCREPLWLPPQAPKGMDESIRGLPSLRCPQCGWTYAGADLIRLGRERNQADPGCGEQAS